MFVGQQLAMCWECRLNIQQLHFKAGVGFIIAILPHSILPAHAINSVFYFDSLYIFKDSFNQTFKHGKNVLLLSKAHLAVDLCKLGLTICTEVFIAKTFYNLVISVISTNHQQLLKCLW